MIKILIIEDDNKLCSEFENVINERENVKLCKKTNSSKDALMAIKFFRYDVIIVDLELHHGTGSGFEFLREFQKMNMKPKPIVIVNTNIMSELVYDNIHSGLADMIFYKKQEDYSAELVIDTLISLTENSLKVNSVEYSEEDKNKIINELINQELDGIGINYKLKGREYIFEAISYLIQNDDTEISIFQYLANNHTLRISSISRAIQTAINELWRTTAIEDLKEKYKAKINVNTGVPTPTEFIYYYVEKIKKIIENF